MKGQLTDKVRIYPILDSISEVKIYLKGISFDELETTLPLIAFHKLIYFSRLSVFLK